MRTEDGERWLLLIHQIPPHPGYLRVKAWRRLQRLGAVAIKASVYALPIAESAFEDLQWVAREIVAAGGEATVLQARLLEGLDDQRVEALFQAARDADYSQVSEMARELQRAASAPSHGDRLGMLADGVGRLRKRLEEIAEIDFFSAPGREPAEGLVRALEEQLAQGVPVADGAAGEVQQPKPVRGRTWVTRKGIHVDRMASAWLIRRFIDPDAQFRFVAGKAHRPEAGELRFDMFDGEFTHEGDSCTFEVLVRRFALTDNALLPIAEIIHDIDLKDDKFARPETVGIEHLVAGIALAHDGDEDRLARAAAVLDDLYVYFTRKLPRRR